MDYPKGFYLWASFRLIRLELNQHLGSSRGHDEQRGD